jgi:hypothetical protein
MQMQPKYRTFPRFSGRNGRIAAYIAACGLLTLLAGCGLLNTGSSSRGQIRSFNAYVPASGNSAAVTIVDGNTALTGGATVGFGQFANAGSYVNAPSGTFTPVATGPGVTGSIQLQTTITSNTAYTLVAAGEAGQTGTLVPQLFVIPNYVNGQLVLPTGTVAVRVVNVSLNPNPIGLYYANGGVPINAVYSSVGSVAYGYSSAANGYFISTPAQLTSFVLIDTTAPTVPLSITGSNTLNNFSFTAGQAYTLYVFGQPGNTAEPLSAIWAQDYPQ